MKTLSGSYFLLLLLTVLFIYISLLHFSDPPFLILSPLLVHLSSYIYNVSDDNKCMSLFSGGIFSGEIFQSVNAAGSLGSSSAGFRWTSWEEATRLTGLQQEAAKLKSFQKWKRPFRGLFLIAMDTTCQSLLSQSPSCFTCFIQTILIHEEGWHQLIWYIEWLLNSFTHVDTILNHILCSLLLLKTRIEKYSFEVP